MASISKPTLNSATLPFPSNATISPVWNIAEHQTIAGKTRRDVMGRKYEYQMEWDVIDTDDYDALEAVVNGTQPVTFTYGKWPQSSAGVSVLAKLSERKLVSGVGTEDYWSTVRLTLTEVDSRI